MKIGIISAILILLAQIGIAQVTDTLGYTEFMMGTPVLYESPNGGFAFGNNGYADRAKAQSYVHENPFVLREVLVQFGAVDFQSGDSTSSVRVNVYDNLGHGITSFGEADSIAPDSILGFVDVPVYQLLDDGNFTTASFAHDTLAILSRFSVGIDLTHMNSADTVGLVSTTDGDAIESFNAWELTATGNWFTVEESAYSWGLEVDFAIFPVIDENDPAGISDLEFDEISIFPNPCKDILYIARTVSRDSRMIIFDALGKEVRHITLDRTSSSIDVSELPTGFYHYSLVNGDALTSGKFVKL